jgi:hypothetical protein
MIKKLYVFIFLLIIIVTLSACTNKQTENNILVNNKETGDKLSVIVFSLIIFTSR